jgi:uncharacterized protein
MKSLSQQMRFVILAIYIFFLLGISKAAFNTWLPPTSELGVWFYAGLASILLGYILSNPFFAPPKDVFSYSISALISIMALNTMRNGTLKGFDYFLWEGVLVYSSLILFVSIAAIFSKDFKDGLGEQVKDISYLLSSKLGDPKVLFSVLYWFAIIVFHRNNPREYLLISLAWLLTVAVPIVEIFADLAIKLKEIVGRKILKHHALIGQIVGYQFPNILLIKHDDSEKVDFATPMIVHGDDGKFGIGIALDYIGYADGRWLRAYRLFSDVRPDALGFLGGQPEAGAYKFEVDNPDQLLGQNEIWKKRKSFIGVVAPDSDAAKLRIDIANSGREIQEGRLVEVYSNNQPVLYQVLNGLTKEDIILQKNTRGYVRADAKKIGVWNALQGRFDVAKWVPQPNSPVFLVDAAPVEPHRDAVGYFPGTAYPVKIEDVDKLVTHNTAILGILGVGKSYLAFELIERMIDKGVKIICLDITNQYAGQLSNFYDAPREKRRVNALKKIGPQGKSMVELNVEEGGSIQQFRTVLKKLITRFLDDSRSDRLVIYNPAEFEVWRQDSKPFQGRASMVSLTPVENAKLITEVALEILQEKGLTDRAKCCIVFEEAHSLIPEWNSVISDGDKWATNGIARAILQGRKYGLGCLVITQRTANVTKSVLNQCNTVFSLRLFDSTGMEFLKNYIGGDYSSVLSTLEDRHAVFFGRASSCKDPVLIQLNNRPEFLTAFRTPTEPSEA